MMKKPVALVVLVIALVNMVLLGLSKIPLMWFWIILTICAFFAWFVVPRMK